MPPQRQPQQPRRFPPEAGRLLVLWLVLLVLGGIEFGLSYLPAAHGLRPLVMLPAAAMIAVVAVGFMNVTRGPVIVRTFAIAALLWLLILLGLGSVDALTRSNYPSIPPAERVGLPEIQTGGSG